MDKQEAVAVRACLVCGTSGAMLLRTRNGRDIRLCTGCAQHKDSFEIANGAVERDPIDDEALYGEFKTAKRDLERARRSIRVLRSLLTFERRRNLGIMDVLDDTFKAAKMSSLPSRYWITLALYKARRIDITAQQATK